MHEKNANERARTDVDEYARARTNTHGCERIRTDADECARTQTNADAPIQMRGCKETDAETNDNQRIVFVSLRPLHIILFFSAGPGRSFTLNILS